MAALFLCGLTVAACATDDSAQRKRLTVSDAWINTRVENEVKPVLKEGETVSASTQGGVVYLDGHVIDIRQAERIEEQVSSITGVREVKNNLVVRR